MLLCMQLLNKELGNQFCCGTLKRRNVREDGQFEIQEEKECPLFKSLETRQLVLLTRVDTERHLNGVQFLPEVDFTEKGRKMLHNFLFDICELQGVFTLEKCEQQCIHTSGVRSDVIRSGSYCKTDFLRFHQPAWSPNFVIVSDFALIPDLIESASHMAFSRADAIKTHQNDSEMVRQLLIYGRVVEPLKDIHIDVKRNGPDATGFYDWTSFPDTHLPQEVVDKMVEAVLTVPGIFRVLYDLTAKPQWTTEWE
ncbi:hypothetical protein OUZ56_001887 [Daphnia magna]|uniref:GMP synthase n=1 Tax=Daphnia magna TaxID=35525 RepID=A0ABR0A4H4_9CRUS|nr:hypothetical protein OUZ56_001887 [Daphnia magna]